MIHYAIYFRLLNFTSLKKVVRLGTTNQFLFEGVKKNTIILSIILAGDLPAQCKIYT